jgi:trk system potassium uptake protein TrkA
MSIDASTQHVVIVGCGRVGSSLARRITAAGHSAAVIDRRPEAFERFLTGWPGDKILGTGIDRECLVAAGIERATAVAAVTSGDNSNIIVARVAREIYGVERVVARIYDSRRAALYARLGIHTIATVDWTVDEVSQVVVGGALDPVGSGFASAALDAGEAN